MVFLLTLRQINQVILSFAKKPLLRDKQLVCSFRCWPVDLDIFMHMNNASYSRVAELATWRHLRCLGFLSSAINNGWALVVTEQKINYLRSIHPFQRYEVLTSFKMDDDKYLKCRQVFSQHPADVKSGADAKIFAIIERTGVIKDRKGQTIRSHLFSVDINNYFES